MGLSITRIVYYKKVFVSYSSIDREEALKITAGFTALHVDFFLDKLYLEGGDYYKDEIVNYISQFKGMCDAFSQELPFEWAD